MADDTGSETGGHGKTIDIMGHKVNRNEAIIIGLGVVGAVFAYLAFRSSSSASSGSSSGSTGAGTTSSVPIIVPAGAASSGGSAGSASSGGYSGNGQLATSINSLSTSVSALQGQLASRSTTSGSQPSTTTSGSGSSGGSSSVGAASSGGSAGSGSSGSQPSTTTSGSAPSSYYVFGNGGATVVGHAATSANQLVGSGYNNSYSSHYLGISTASALSQARAENAQIDYQPSPGVFRPIGGAKLKPGTTYFAVT